MGMLNMATTRQREFDEQDRSAKNNSAQVGQDANKSQEQEKPEWHNYAQNQRDAARDKVEGKGLGTDLQRDQEERKVAQEQEKNFHQKHGRHHRSGEELDKSTYEHDNDPKVIKYRQVDAYREANGRFPRNDSDLTRFNDKQAKAAQEQNQGQTQAAPANIRGAQQTEQGEDKGQATAQSRFGEKLAARQGNQQAPEHPQEQAPANQQEQTQRKGPPSLEEGVIAARVDAQTRSAQVNQEQQQGKVRSLSRD